MGKYVEDAKELLAAVGGKENMARQKILCKRFSTNARISQL